MVSIPTTFDRLTDFAWVTAETLLPRLLLAAAILVGGVLLAQWVARAVAAALSRTGQVDETALPALAAAARYGVLILAGVAALSQIGVQTASMLAALGAAGLAIGLALQGTLANIAAGIMLLWLRPFRVGDAIEIVSPTPFSGTVMEIGLFACRLETSDGLYVFAPNSSIWSYPLRNYSANPRRLVSLDISFAPGADLERAKEILLDIISEEPGVLKEPHPDVFVGDLRAGAAIATCRLWVKPSAVEAVQRGIIEVAPRALNEAGLQPTHMTRTTPPDPARSRLQ